MSAPPWSYKVTILLSRAGVTSFTDDTLIYVVNLTNTTVPIDSIFTDCLLIHKDQPGPFTEFPLTISHLAKLPSDYLCTILYKIVQYTRTRSTPLHKVYSLITIPSLITINVSKCMSDSFPSPCKVTRLLPRADAIVYRQHAYTQDSFKPLHKVYSLTTIPSLIALNVSKCRPDSSIIL